MRARTIFVRPIRPASAVVLAAVTAALVATACSGSSNDAKSSGAGTPAASTGSGATSPAKTPTSGTKKPAAPTVDPLNGLAPNNHGVVAVKIDDTSSGRPQVDIDQADNVYIEEVEGGLTRLLAVYNSHLPTVEAVRSTRAGDPEVLAQYGPIAYVASGGAYNPLKVLDASDLKSSINDRGGPGFQRDGNRPIPYNLRANLAEVASKLKAPKAKPIGFHWAWQSPQLAGKKTANHIRTTVGGTGVAFDYYPSLHRYVRVINGVAQKTASGHLITASNVVVQFCDVTVYTKDRDVNGNPNKYTHTVGSGKAVLFRNGKRVDGAWYRKYYHGGTRWAVVGHKTMLFRPGNVWVVLVARHTALSP